MVEEAEICLDERPDAPSPATMMPGCRLVGELDRSVRVIEGPLQTARPPLGHGQAAEHAPPGQLVAASCRGRRRLLEDCAGTIDLADDHEMPAQGDARALVVLERETKPVLDLHTALEQARSDLGRPRLGSADLGDRGGEKNRVPDLLSELECSPAVGEPVPDVAQHQLHETPIGEDARRAGVVARCLGERLPAELPQLGEVGGARQNKGEEDVGSGYPGRDLGQDLLEERDGPPRIPGEAVEICRPNATLPHEIGIARCQAGCELAELRGRGGCPAGGRVLGRLVEVGGGEGVRTDHGKGHVTRPLLDVRDRP